MRRSPWVNDLVLHRSNLMTPLEQIPSEGDARLKMTTSSRVGRTGRRSIGVGNEINKEVINIRRCLVNVAVRFGITIYSCLTKSPPGDQWGFNSCPNVLDFVLSIFRKFLFRTNAVSRRKLTHNNACSDQKKSCTNAKYAYIRYAMTEIDNHWKQC